MRELRRLWPHLILLLAAAAFAFAMSRPEDEKSRPMEPGEVELWGGNVDDITRITYQGKRKLVSLEARKDDHGRWYYGQVDPAPEQEEEPELDAGADAGRRPRPRPVTPIESATFAAVELADKLAEKLAPARAKRTIGEVTPDRLEVFGLDDPEGTLRVEFGDKVRVLVIGGRTPGGSDRYARVQQTGLVYVIDNAIVRDISGGDVRLSERKLHAWKDSDVAQAVIMAGDKERRVVRAGTEGRRFWADAASPDQPDETVANWLQKLQRLRPTKYFDELPEDATKFVRIDYRSTDGDVGFVELHRRVFEEKDEYFVTSEQMRLHATVPASLGEQLEEDLPSLLP